MNTTNIERRLKDHDRLCKMHEYSLGDARRCTCGRDEAVKELKALRKRVEELEVQPRAARCDGGMDFVRERSD